MIEVNGKVYRNLQEQVYENTIDIDELKRMYGYRGPYESTADIENPVDLGLYLIGTEAPYAIYQYHEVSGNYTNIGIFNERGPQGPVGPQGPQGETGAKGDPITITVNDEVYHSYMGNIDLPDYPHDGVWGSIVGTLSNQTDLQAALDAKQNKITDLDEIRTGAALGATAVQPSELDNYYDKEEIDDKLDLKADAADIPTKVSELENDENYVTAETLGTDYVTTATDQDIYAQKTFKNENEAGIAWVDNGGLHASFSTTTYAKQVAIQPGEIILTKTGYESGALTIKHDKLTTNSTNYYTFDSASTGIARMSDIPDVSNFVTDTELATTLDDYELKADAFSGNYADLTNKPDLSVYELKSEAFSGSYNDLSNKPDLTVYELKSEAFSGDYDDLTDKPDLSVYAETADLGDCAYLDENELSIAYSQITGAPSIPTKTSDLTNDSGYITGVTWNDVTNKPTFATVATTGDYDDLLNKPTLFSGNYNDLSNKPDLSIYELKTDAFSGDYADLTNKPDLSVYELKADAFSGSYNDLTDKPTLFSGDYDDLTDKPDLSVYELKADAFSGDYNDLTNKPTIPTVPTNVSAFTNDAGYITSSDLPTNHVTTNTAQTITGAKTFTATLDVVNTEKGIKLHSGTNHSTNAKLGFTLFNSTAGSSSNEVGFLESNTNTVANNGHSTLLGYYNTSRDANYSDWELGFAYRGYNTTKRNDTAYKLMVPNQYNLNAYSTKRYIPIDFTNGTNTVRSDATGIVDISTLLPTVPTKTSDLTNDSGFITGITSSDVTTALGYTPGTSNFSGSYTDLTDKPTIPTVVDTVADGNMNAVTSNAVYDLVGDIETLLQSI